LLQDIYEWSTPVLKIRKLLLADLLKCSINDGDLIEYGGVTWFKGGVDPLIIN
jgi:hypothetical protein